MSRTTRLPTPIVVTSLLGSTLLGAIAGCSSGKGTNPGGTGGSGGEADSGTDGSAPALSRPWDWAGVIGTGQSLAVGQMGTPAATTSQPYGNLKLSTGTLPWPVDPNHPSLAMVPLNNHS